nr:unnamed protein product [Callosobruchus analis]
MEVDQEHAYAFNENPLEVDPLALVGTTIKEEIKDEPDLISENFVQHEVHKEVSHEVQNDVHHEIKLEDVDECASHDVQNKYAQSFQALRKQSDVLAQTHVEMQVQIANLKEEKAQLWKDLAAEKTKEYTYVKEIRDIKASCDRRLKNMRNKYER